MGSRVSPRPLPACPECGSTSSHQRGCGVGKNLGHGIGQKRRRTALEDRVFRRNRQHAFMRDRWTCRICGDFEAEVHPHHVETIQTVLARGGDFMEADRVENLLTVCPTCHGIIHSAAGIDQARREGWIIDAESKRNEVNRETGDNQ